MNSSYHHRVSVLGELGAATSSQLSSTSASVLVPLGSTEQHGPHLPLDTDTRIAAAVAGGAQARLGHEWLVAPAIAYGASGEHQSFAGTISLGTEALTLLLVEYGRSAAGWARRLVFVNGHGGNVEACRRAVALLRTEGRDVGWSPCLTAGGDAHAGHTETSVLLHISPAVVRTEQSVAGNTAPLPELLGSMRRGGVAAVSPVGVLGDPTTATAAEGKRIFAEMVDGCVRRVSRWRPGPDGMLT
ncbi:mycofactocin system creatininase family protein [Mycobacterium colombiense]|uniref:mycofactocin biosynthesis peptidyl-dipeptidase MftE n=1 Tax=Mycobacterium colombiense TaxID=339268 RepID=UPI0007ED8CE5|nr:mycofactocin biosynthesis peptidyl-dipeptidase MftE [Mycobacterium colombiense]OBJ16124.1 mycofactocin system creatininase family protein [Mycobacterium colombiense]OBJ40766.1 mycofactocin system creatininase family protein [Mycobacterium colombiense]OBJ46405.1 mycofactocin system creatininase family protein [Mycobacterium colombiense]OBJ66098.1 mycofactocin system creatininase family protein [Mycobacterium colombiense]OBK57518.1 mycofactocin system creatininase family protein [Mycobacteriu